MSDQLTNKEKAIRDLLQREQPIATGDIWSQIEGNLPPEPAAAKKRRVIPFWWMAGLFVMTSASMLIGYGVATIPASPKAEEKSTASPSSRDNISSKTEKTNVVRAKRLADITKGEASQQTRVAQLTIDARTSETNSSVAPQKETPRLKAKAQTNTSPSNSQNKLSENTARNLQNTLNPATVKLATNIPATRKTSTPLTKLNESEKASSEAELQTVSLNTIPSLALRVQSEPNLPTPSRAMTKPVSTTHGRRPFHIRISTGILQNNSSTAINSGSELDPAYLQRETDRLGTDFGIDIGAHIAGWSVFAGLGYNTSITSYQRTDITESASQELGTEYIVIDENGNSAAVAGQVETTTSIYHDINWHRRHTVLELRTGLGKTIYQRGLWSIGLEGTVGYALHTAHSGYQFAEQENAFVKLDGSGNTNYRKNMGWSAALSLPVAFQVRNTVLAIAPTYRYLGNSITNTNNFYQIKNSQIGIQFSITYQPRWEQF